MSATALLIKRYLRKRPGQIIALTLLIAFTAVLVNMAYILGVSYPADIDAKASHSNAADAMYVVPAGDTAALFEQTLKEDSRVDEIEVDNVLFSIATVKMNDEDTTTGIVLSNWDDAPTMNKVEVVSEAGDAQANPVWAAYILESSGSYKLGDEITFWTGERTATFHIQAFTEDLYTSAPQMGAISIAVPAADFAAMAENPMFSPAVAVKVQGNSPEKAISAMDDAVVAVQESGLPGADQFANQWGMHLGIMKSGTMLGANIFAVAFLAFAGLIVAVALIVMRFLIKNLITADMTSIGAMRAVGFTTSDIIRQLSLTFGVTALIASSIGVGLSYLALPAISSGLAAQTGLVWNVAFNLPALILTIGGLTVAMLLFAIVAALRVRSVTTVAALRGGEATHSFRRNHMPLDRTGGPVNAVLGLKSITQRPSQNVVMALTVAVVAFASVFAVGMTTNLLANPTAFSRLVAGDIEDVTLGVNLGADSGELIAAAEALPGVEKAFRSTLHGTTIGGRTVAVHIADDFGVLRYDSIYEGRAPQHENEVALGGKLADELGLEVGDTWTIDMAGRTADYLVTGLTSSSRGLGQSLSMTTAGYQRLDPTFTHNAVAIYVNDGVDPDTVIKEMEATHADSIAVAVNGPESAESQLSGYLSMVGTLAGVVIAFTVLVVVLVVGLIVTTMIAQSRRHLGVHKAVGFTSRDLTAQTMWSYLPVVGIGAIVGGIVGAIGLNPILSWMLAGIGVMKTEFSMSPWHVVLLVLGVLALAAVVTWIASRRIGTISAYQLVSA